MNTNTTRRTPPRLNTCRVAAMLMAAGAMLAASGAHAQMGQNPTPPPSPAPAPPAPAIAPEPPSVSAGGVSSTYSMTVNEDGKTIKLEMKNGVVTHAEIDGKAIPDDRIENDGDVVRLKDESGEVVYEHELPNGAGWGGHGFAAFDLNNPAWRSLNRLGSGATFNLNGGLSGLRALPGGLAWATTEPDDDAAAAEPFKAPPVMIGVQLGTPDSTLCGHLGIERDNATLLMGVHEGLPAANAGLEPYDLIVAINGSDQAGPAAIRKALEDKKAGDTVNLGVIHKGVRKDVTVTLEGYDRKKLSSAKASRVKSDDNTDRFMIATAPEAPLPPLPPSIPEQYRKEIEQYFKANRAPRAVTISPFGRRTGPGAAAAPLSDQHRKLLSEVERRQEEAAAQVADAARAASEYSKQLKEKLRTVNPNNVEEMRERMQRMEKMLEQLMNEKLEKDKSQQPKSEPRT